MSDAMANFKRRVKIFYTVQSISLEITRTIIFVPDITSNNKTLSKHWYYAKQIARDYL